MTVEDRKLPLSAHRLFATRDLDEARDRIAQAYKPHRLNFAASGQPLDTEFRRVSVGSASLNLLRYGADVVIEPGALESFYLIQIPLAGRCEIDHGGRTVGSDAAVASIVSPTRPVTMRWGADCDQLMLQIERKALERFMEEAYQVTVRDPLVFDPELPLETGCGASLKNLLLFIGTEFDRGSPVATTPAVANQLTAAAVSLLLAGQPNSYSTALAPGRSAAAPTHLKRALDFMEANLDQPVTLAQIVQASGVSMRALFDSFHRFRNCTPMAYLKARRLEKARAQLASGEVPSVTEAALAWGFSHFGNFSADYKRSFGESPSETLRRARGR